MAEKMSSPVKQALFLLVIVALIGGGMYRQRKNFAEANKKKGDESTETVAPFYEQIGVMGTFGSVTFYETDARANAKAARAVFQIFNDINTRFSNYNPSSELSRINRLAFKQEVKCSAPMWAMLDWCRTAHKQSHGAFDISAGPIVKLWGIYRKEKKQLPPESELTEALKRVGLDKVTFNDESQSIRFTVDGMYLDVGGIAKGYAVDLAVDAVRKQGISRGIIDLGGNLYCLEEPPPGRDHYNVGIRNPFQSAPHQPPGAIVSYKGMGIATSGNYERYVTIDGKRYAHIMDIRTGTPIQEMAGVSVIAEKAVVSDMLSTAIYINGERHIDELLKAYPEIKVLIVKKQEGKAPVIMEFPKGDPFWKDLPSPDSWEKKQVL